MKNDYASQDGLIRLRDAQRRAAAHRAYRRAVIREVICGAVFVLSIVLSVAALALEPILTGVTP